MTDADEALGLVVREEWGRLTALLLARFRRLDLVEDALGDAVATAVERWPGDGVPSSPAAWLLTAATRRLLDRLRTEQVRDRKQALLLVDAERDQEGGAHVMADPGDLVEDDLLRLVLMCTHPALAPENAGALALRLVLGVSTADIGRLYLITESTAAARITRAKQKIAAAGIPFAIPRADALPERLETVGHVAYLAFTAGYAPGSGPDLLRAHLAGEGIRLTRVARQANPDDPSLTALLALMLLQHSRRDARLDAHGHLVLLANQDRTRWHDQEIREATELLRSKPLEQPLTAAAAAYALQARIAAEHARAPSAEETNWPLIVRTYDLLLTLGDNPSVRLARAVAVAEAQGPHAGLEALDGITLPGSHRVDAARAELLRRSGDMVAARAAYDQAIAACRNDPERRHLERQRERLD